VVGVLEINHEQQHYESKHVDLDFLRWWFGTNKLREHMFSPHLHLVTRDARSYDSQVAHITLDSFKLQVGPRVSVDNWDALALNAQLHTHMIATAGFYRADKADISSVRYLFGVVLDLDKPNLNLSELLSVAHEHELVVNLVNKTPRGWQVWFSLGCHRTSPWLLERYNRVAGHIFEVFQHLGFDPHSQGVVHPCRIPDHVTYVNTIAKNNLLKLADQLPRSTEVTIIPQASLSTDFNKWWTQPALVAARLIPIPEGHREVAAFWLARVCCTLGASQEVAKQLLTPWVVGLSKLPKQELDHALKSAYGLQYTHYTTVPVSKLRVVPTLD
jgi:hypothetical protein